MRVTEVSLGDARGLSGIPAGTMVSLSGRLLTLRDAAQARLEGLLSAGSPPPFDLDGMVVFYVSPAPGRNGLAVGSAGPTTAARMDCWLRMLLSLGVTATIGKGPRSSGAAALCREHGAPYLAAVGGAGAFYASRIRSCRVVAWPDLGPEAVHSMEVESFPAFVGIDSEGCSMFPGTGRDR